VERLSIIAARIEREIDPFRSILDGIGWVSFALITADYAGFIRLPAIMSVPLWLGFLLACLRWAVWEGLIKPRLHVSADPPGDREMVAPPLQDTDEPSQT
jgi:hypothetical protein